MSEIATHPENEAGHTHDLFPKIERVEDPEALKHLDESQYQFFQLAAKAKPHYDYQGQVIGVKEGADRLKPGELEKIMLQDCDTLAAIYTGEAQRFVYQNKSPYLFEQPRSQEPIDAAIYLDKSARPVSALMRYLWPYLSDGDLPSSYFVNIDKNPYLQKMGFGKNGENFDNIPLQDISLDLLDPAIRRDLVLRLRSLYLEPRARTELLTESSLNAINSGTISIEQPHPLQEAMSRPTIFDNKHVAVVDEVKSSGATLYIADLLFNEALPRTTIEPVYWSVPNRIYWNNGKEYANDYVPVWYSKDRPHGRGGIGEIKEEWHLQSPHYLQHVAAPLLSTPFLNTSRTERHPDDLSIQVRHDMRLMADRFHAGLARYIPSNYRSEEDFEQRQSHYLENSSLKLQ